MYTWQRPKSREPKTAPLPTRANSQAICLAMCMPHCLPVCHTAECLLCDTGDIVCCLTQQTPSAVAHSRQCLLCDTVDIACCVAQQKMPVG